MNKFFDFTANQPASAGFGRFSAAHLSLLPVFALLLVGAFLLCRKRPGPGRALSRAAVWLGLLTELGRGALLLALGLYDRGRLPLHLCTLSVYLYFLHMLRPGPTLGQFIYAFSLPGAAFALVFPDWADYPLWHFVSLSSFLLHFFLLLYPVTALALGDIRPDIRRLPRSIALMLAMALPVWALDRLLDTNYMFLNWPPAGTPLELFAPLGRSGYLLGFIPLALAVWLLLYLKQLRIPEKKGEKMGIFFFFKENPGTKGRDAPS